MRRTAAGAVAAIVAAIVATIVAAVVATAAPVVAQTPPTDDPVLRRIWSLGMDSTQAAALLQTLSDSIGPRLTGTPQMRAANDWAVATYARWGVRARSERVGTWRGWRRGTAHVDLLRPRARSLEARMLSWSPGTRGRDVTAPVVLLPDVADTAAFARWLPQARGKFVLVSFAEPTCRPDESWERWATPETIAAMRAERARDAAAWAGRVRRTGLSASGGTGTLGRRLEEAGAAGVITSRWSGGWGVNKVYFTRNATAPAVDVSCEDYGLLFRLAERGQGPVLRVRSDAELSGDVPTFNTVAELRGVETPDEYVLLSAHFDSWDAASGTTDNGTGTVIMMEAMRLLSRAYPRPKRTIVVGHWVGEEQGLNGSRAFAEDHPDVVNGMQALFNQDNGTGRVSTLWAAGLVDVGPALDRWVARLPTELSGGLTVRLRAVPGGDGSDDASFACHGAPAITLGSLPWDYSTYTWHTTHDTFDKASLDDVKRNATLTAMLAYLASEDPQRVSRERRPLAAGERWPACVRAMRRGSEYFP